MRLATLTNAGRTSVAVFRDQSFFPTPYRSMVDLIADGADGLASVAQASRNARPLADGAVAAPIPRPRMLLFAGVNYHSHLDEVPSASTPDEPFVFAKLPSSVIGPDEPIAIPAGGHKVDYEGELAIVVGERSGDPIRDPMDMVFGYTIVNDVSARDVQFDRGQLILGKGFDTFCPMGPIVVLRDEIPDPSVMTLTTRVNGDVRQQAPLTDMIFQVRELLTFLSSHVTLAPGDVISTGTPAGVGYFRTPPSFLQPGDTVEIEIDGIGVLRNPVAAIAASGPR
jgi:2,4-didehydro-3-deoxy-L-rhamnonate hydrolase